MNRIYLPNYNLEATLLGGQSFGWDKIGEWFYGFTQEVVVKLKREGDFIIWQTYPEKDRREWLMNYLRAEKDFKRVEESMLQDEHVKKAYDSNPNLRLLRQGLDEALLGFLVSPTKSIVGIRQCIRLMAQRWGEKVKVDDITLYKFPTTTALAEASEAELRECKVGFRAPNIKAAAERLLDEDWRNRVLSSEKDDLIEGLKELRGVGDKVADCVAVYGLSKDYITPLDVWGMRFMQQLYGFDEKAKYKDMRSWIIEEWGSTASLRGQHLFEWFRAENMK